MEVITIKLDKNMLKNIDSSLKSSNYSTRTEFIRDAIRIRLTVLEKEAALRRLQQNFGILKGKIKISDEEAGRLATEEYLKKYGLKLD